MRERYSVIIVKRSVGESFSEIEVNPAISENSTVNSFFSPQSRISVPVSAIFRTITGSR